MEYALIDQYFYVSNVTRVQFVNTNLVYNKKEKKFKFSNTPFDFYYYNEDYEDLFDWETSMRAASAYGLRCLSQKEWRFLLKHYYCEIVTLRDSEDSDMLTGFGKEVEGLVIFPISKSSNPAKYLQYLKENNNFEEIFTPFIMSVDNLRKSNAVFLRSAGFSMPGYREPFDIANGNYWLSSRCGKEFSKCIHFGGLSPDLSSFNFNYYCLSVRFVKDVKK